LDLSLRATGVCVLTADGQLLHLETIEGTLPKKATTEQKIDRLIQTTQRIVEIAREYEAQHAGIESFAHNAFGSQNVLGELHGVVKTQMVLACGIVPVVVQMSTARKDILGKGRADKRAIKALAIQRATDAGMPVADDNQADAWVVAEWLRRKVLEA
jgi:Holliday junction resolvasome RuvABC endonuclease subunit